jgi:hypothetical protein
MRKDNKNYALMGGEDIFGRWRSLLWSKELDLPVVVRSSGVNPRESTQLIEPTELPGVSTRGLGLCHVERLWDRNQLGDLEF